MIERWRLMLLHEPNFRGERTLSVQIGPDYDSEMAAIAAKKAHPEWQRTVVQRFERSERQFFDL